MIVTRDVGPASWAFSTYARSREEEVTLFSHPAERSKTDFLPLTGFDRNQPFRRNLGMLGTEIPLRRLDPGVVYHFGDSTLTRPASVEGWIEACAEDYPGRGTRDLWENIWNLSAIAWNYIDRYGVEPWQPPNPAFPYLNPSFWQGLSRARLLFANTSGYLETFSIERRDHLRSWLDSVLRFTYGTGIENTPLGMAAMALNAPSESYRFAEESNSIRQGWLGDSHIDAEAGEPMKPVLSREWTASFATGRGLDTDATPIHQFFFLTSPLEALFAQTVVLVSEPSGWGTLYVRLEPDSSEETVCGILKALQTLLESLLSDWGRIDLSSASPAAEMIVEKTGSLHATGIEAHWPWLGQVLSYVSARRWLERFRKDRALRTGEPKRTIEERSPADCP